ncbi:quinoprotein relay system zinc metallohydrolase 1 [Oceanospirillum sanctuarii]|uniref:quinoprotein relay system zinc metallohydrolase 1 n=1 Tax=Oceanospirillum sanctuarii TaxID=1434821 RepID=UPI000A3A220D|nr:quinoprotein relay system zinc metallohydrolase 1 [Oceanospirillum sanctuarii]
MKSMPIKNRLLSQLRLTLRFWLERLHSGVVLVGILFFWMLSGVSFAATPYEIKPVNIAPDTWVVMGKNEPFTPENGGMIANIGIILTEQETLVFDTGPSRAFAEALSVWIKEQGGGPIRYVLNSHAHPDHFLGNQVFPQNRTYSAEPTQRMIVEQGPDLAENLYRMVGAAMKGTRSVAPGVVLKEGVSKIVLGSGSSEHQLEVRLLDGHSHGDLILLDRTTGVLFAGDLVFYNRALTTPHAVLNDWLAALDQLEGLSHSLLVPGHGPVHQKGEGIKQTRDYLKWLDKSFKQGAEEGWSMAEMLNWPLNPAFKSVVMQRYEFTRSLSHWYPQYEENALKQ